MLGGRLDTCTFSHLVHVPDPSIWEATALQPSGSVDNYVAYHYPVGSSLIVVQASREVGACARGITAYGTCTCNNTCDLVCSCMGSHKVISICLTRLYHGCNCQSSSMVPAP